MLDGHYLKGNLIAGNTGGQGVFIDASGGTAVGISRALKNKVLNGIGGIELKSCNLTVVKVNYCDTDVVGIHGGTDSRAVIFANGGQLMTFEKNVITGNSGFGLFGFKSSFVSKNKVFNNVSNGIDASSGASSLIEKNIAKGNGDGATTFDLYGTFVPPEARNTTTGITYGTSLASPAQKNRSSEKAEGCRISGRAGGCGTAIRHFGNGCHGPGPGRGNREWSVGQDERCHASRGNTNPEQVESKIKM